MVYQLSFFYHFNITIVLYENIVPACLIVLLRNDHDGTVTLRYNGDGVNEIDLETDRGSARLKNGTVLGWARRKIEYRHGSIFLCSDRRLLAFKQSKLLLFLNFYEFH